MKTQFSFQAPESKKQQYETSKCPYIWFYSSAEDIGNISLMCLLLLKIRNTL